MSEALHALLYSQEGNLTVAIPSCSLMDITIPTLPSTPLPTTYRGITFNYNISVLSKDPTDMLYQGAIVKYPLSRLPSLTWTSEPIFMVSLKPPRAQSAATACLPMA